MVYTFRQACRYNKNGVEMKMFMLHSWYSSDRCKPKYSEVNLSQWRFVHNEFRIIWARIEPGLPRWETGNWLPERWRDICVAGY